MYTAILWPQITYASLTWPVRAGHGFQGAIKAATKALNSIQWQILYRIAGAFRTTSRATLQIALHVLPAPITVARQAEEGCLRIYTSPLHHLLHEIRRSGQRPLPKTQRDHARLSRLIDPNNDSLMSPLERLEWHLAIKRMEVVHPYVCPPWWDGPSINIADTRNQPSMPTNQCSGREPISLPILVAAQQSAGWQRQRWSPSKGDTPLAWAP